uniref:Tetracycline efflux MFS transporter Tet(A) n=1 Tax=Escherichia coli TaxID=562 RepID=A0A3G4RRP3_ECOLX|nr:tetracycline efflux MFS transporter Tet(A) [Escherichia coli]
MKPNRPLIVILSTVALDAVGIGLIMPVLPGLLRDLVHSNDAPPTMAFCWRCMR